jgi:hypothetical protein
VTWLGAFLTVAGVLVVLGLVAAAVLDRRARAQGQRLHPQPARERARRRSPGRSPARRRRSDDRFDDHPF